MNESNIVPSIFESFNARYLAPRLIAKSFVPSEHFERLAKHAHTLLVGPRGSGKTTLLKMLQGEALESWNHVQADKYRQKIDFTGVFVPTDVNWYKQIEGIDNEILNLAQRRLFSKSAFTTHVLHKLITAIIYRVYPPQEDSLNAHRRVILSKDKEMELVKELADAWYLKPRIATLLALKHTLLSRVAKLPEIVSFEANKSNDEKNDNLNSINFFHIDFLKAALFAIEVFDDFVGESGSRWAFLFDELELAPQSIVQGLLDSLRSMDDRLFFKLSLAPFNPELDIIKDILSGTPGNDYEIINLWYANKDEGHPFCKEMLTSMLRERKLPLVEPEKIFGLSHFETPHDQYKTGSSAYKANSKYGKLFTHMSAIDKSVRSYFEANGININSIDNITDSERASKLRKVSTILKVRHEFRAKDHKREEVNHAIQRSRKALPLIYSGATSIFNMVEGNPRWFIGIVGPLLDEYAATDTMVPARKQMEEIKKAIHRFRSLLKTIPCPVSQKGSPPVGVDKAIDIIGEYFHKRVVVDKFNPEPPGSFSIDPDANEDLISSLGLALNAGAIVYVPGSSAELVMKSLIKHRFRISYLLAPHYKIPILLMRAVSLKTIFASCNNELSLFSHTKDYDEE